MRHDPADPPPIGLSELAARLGVDEREVRYVLGKGVVPPGVEPTPGRGRHRRFDARQAFWLAIVLRLKAAGLNVPLAGRVATYAEMITHMSVGMQWDWRFSPFSGQLRTSHDWFLEVADACLARFQTDGQIGRTGFFDLTMWVDMETRVVVREPKPFVVVRVDLSELGRLLLGERDARHLPDDAGPEVEGP